MDKDKALRNMFRSPNPFEIELEYNPRLRGKNRKRIVRWVFLNQQQVEEAENKQRKSLIDEGVI